jgi:hypothetical protein
MGKGVFEGADEIIPQIFICLNGRITPVSRLLLKDCGLILDPIFYFVPVEES